MKLYLLILMWNKNCLDGLKKQKQKQNTWNSLGPLARENEVPKRIGMEMIHSLNVFLGHTQGPSWHRPPLQVHTASPSGAPSLG